jgi:predicted DsbA family dithiol-disulfide isomerase
MSLPTLEIYGSMDCPYAYLATYRLRQVWPEYAGRLQIAWRPLPLEYVNRTPARKPVYDTERSILAQVEPALPYHPWPRPDWQWPVTMWPAFEALACAQAQGHDAAFAMSWALRYGFYGEGRCLSLRHELLDIAGQAAREAPLDLKRFEEDWDSGRYKESVIAAARRGWHELKVEGSATFVLPDGRQVTNPGLGEVDYDEENNIFRGYTPPERDWRDVYREMLESVAAQQA